MIRFNRNYMAREKRGLNVWNKGADHVVSLFIASAVNYWQRAPLRCTSYKLNSSDLRHEKKIINNSVEKLSFPQLCFKFYIGEHIS